MADTPDTLTEEQQTAIRDVLKTATPNDHHSGMSRFTSEMRPGGPDITIWVRDEWLEDADG